MAKEKSAPIDKSEELVDSEKELILFNDEYNTFDFVIETLIEVCGHDLHQAEQCAWIAHYKGKCAVKSGTFNELKPLFDEMSIRDLTVSID
jgi:ATP-dependent Clp protease adaptor protein ClpS